MGANDKPELALRHSKRTAVIKMPNSAEWLYPVMDCGFRPSVHDGGHLMLNFEIENKPSRRVGAGL